MISDTLGLSGSEMVGLIVGVVCGGTLLVLIVLIATFTFRYWPTARCLALRHDLGCISFLSFIVWFDDSYQVPNLLYLLSLIAR